MKTIQKVIVFFLVFGTFQGTQAQFFKKLKDKVKRAAEETVERKVEDKAIETTEKAIDSVFTIGNGKGRKEEKGKSVDVDQNETENVASYGTATVSGPNHGPIEIIEIAQPTVSFDQGAGQTRISAWWVTHGTDTDDRFAITLNQLIDEATSLPRTVTLPQDGTLSIYYDGLLGAYLPADEWQRTEDPEFELVHNNPQISGTLTLRALDENKIAFSFEGSGFSGQVQATNPKIQKIALGNNTTDSNKGSSTSPAFSFKEGEPGIYDFNFEIETLVTADDGERYPISYLINSNTDYFGMKVDMSAYGEGDVEGNSVMVMDQEQVRVFVDTPMMKMQLNQDMAGAQGQKMPEMGNYDFTKPQKTGKTKTIIGYRCEEYVVTHEEGTIHFWAAPDLTIPNWMFGSQQAVAQTGVLGFVMEFSATSKQGTTKSTVTAINDDLSLRINAKDYKKMF